MIILQRKTERDGGTFGIIYNEAMERLAVSLELPWKDNQHQISCIPVGEYDLEPITHWRLGNVLRVLNVPDRDGILIHSANLPKELLGCIAPGQFYGQIAGENGIIDSRKALESLLILKPEKIKIINAE